METHFVLDFFKMMGLPVQAGKLNDSIEEMISAIQSPALQNYNSAKRYEVKEIR